MRSILGQRCVREAIESVPSVGRLAGVRETKEGLWAPQSERSAMNVAPGARRYALALGVLAIPLFVLVLPVGLLAAAAAGGVLWFHRDPERRPPPAGAVSPADGTVSVLREEGGRVRLGVFMSPTDVHVNRAPLGGTVRTVEHEPGGHWPAFSKASERNERVRIAIETGSRAYELELIAGAFARRVHPYIEPGDDLERGDRVGHISFGSRVDIVFPADVDLADVLVTEGEAVRAGETMVALRD